MENKTILEVISSALEAGLFIGDVRSFFAKKVLDLAFSSMLSVVKSIQDE